ncbi:dNA primase [Bacteroides sp. CAG:709]|nr:dNA primase [Bacteroides sp. CAG:709]
MIPQDTVDKILDSAQIVDVISDFVSLKRRGANYIACCPFHNEKTPSFYVSPAKGIYKCFGCGKSGTAVGFVMEHESMTYVEALKYLARKYGIEVKEKEDSPEEIAARQRNESLLLVMDYTEQFFKDSLKTQEGRSIGYAYFRSRGLEDATIEKYGLGWSPKSGHALAEAALAKGYKEEFLTATGVCIKRNDGSLIDKFYDRAMFPIHSVSGRVIAFGGRTLRSDYKTANIGKYVNSPETEIYDKSRSLYGIYFAKSEISKLDKCYLVEGYLDVLSMHQLGITNVVASSGTSLTVPQIRLIKKFTDNVTIMYDGDAAGIHAALRGIGLILKEGLNVRVVLLPDGDDPDSYSQKHNLEEVQAFLQANEQDFIEYKTDLLLGQSGNDPLKKAELINDIADTIALIPDQIKRAVYVQSAAVKFGINEDALYARILNTRQKMIDDERKEAERERMREERQARANAGPQSAGANAGGQSIPLPEDYGEPAGDGYMDGQMEPVDVTVPADTAPARANAGGVYLENPVMAPVERDLLKFILVSGLDTMDFESDSEFYDSEKTTAADFIRDAIEEHPFSNSLFARTFDEYFKLYDADATLGQDDIIRSLMNSPDREMASLVGDLVEEKYRLTVKNFSDAMTSQSSFLVIQVPKAIMVYNSKIVRSQELALAARLKELGRMEKTPETMAEEAEILVKFQKVAELRKKIVGKLGRVQ